MRDSLRTFVAVELPGEVKQLAAQLIERLRIASADVRWVHPDQMHWTLKFLGEVDLVDVNGICHAVAEAVAPLAPFDIDVRGAGAFPTRTIRAPSGWEPARGSRPSSSCTRRWSAAWAGSAFGPSSAASVRTSRWAGCRRAEDGLGELAQLHPATRRVRCRHCDGLRGDDFFQRAGPQGAAVRAAGTCGAERQGMKAERTPQTLAT